MFTFGVPAPVKYALAVYANLEAENTQWILGLSCVFFFFFALSAGNATMWPISGGRFSHVGGLVGESELTFKTWTIRNSFLGFVVWASFSHRAILSLWVHIKALYKFGMLPLAKSSLPWRDTQQELVRIKKKKTLKFIGQKCNTLFISEVGNVDSGRPLSCRAPTLKKPGQKYLTASWKPWLAGSGVFD